MDVEDGAFSITNLGVPNGTNSLPVPGLLVDTDSSSGVTIAMLTFSDGDSVISRGTANTLADGNYRLDVVRALITGGGGGPAMANDYLFGATEADRFHRLYGDSNGDGQVDFIDFSSGFLPAFGTNSSQGGYADELDANGDGNVDFNDFSAGFLTNFGNGR